MSEQLSDQIHRLAKEAVDRLNAERARQEEAARLAALPTPEQQLAFLQLRDRVRDAALAYGARPRYVRFIVWEAEESFELKDGQIVPRDGRRNPHDPVAPLDLITFLEGLRETDANLFLPQTEPQTRH
jgi:hypothetical protein